MAPFVQKGRPRRSIAPVSSSTAKRHDSGGDGGNVTRALSANFTPGVGCRNVAYTRLDTQSTGEGTAANAMTDMRAHAKRRQDKRFKYDVWDAIWPEIVPQCVEWCPPPKIGVCKIIVASGKIMAFLWEVLSP